MEWEVSLIEWIQNVLGSLRGGNGAELYRR